jgi:hypothetical protein
MWKYAASGGREACRGKEMCIVFRQMLLTYSDILLLWSVSLNF